MRILAIDPAAETEVSDTGWALLGVSVDDSKEPKLLDFGVFSGGFAGFLRAQLPAHDILVCEKFVLYKGAADPTPLLIEGVVRSQHPNVVLQQSSALATIKESQLKRIGWYHKDGHHRDANSAIRHALYYLRSLRHRGTLKLLSR